MKKYLKINKEAIRVAISSAAAYRADFLLSMIITLLSNVLYPLVTILVYRTGASYDGWNMYEVLLIQAVFTMSSGISSMFFESIVWSTMRDVQNGTLEIILIKPVNCMVYLIVSGFNVYSIGVVIGGIIMFTISIIKLGFPSPDMWIVSLIFFAMGILVMLAMQLLMAATSFKWVANSRIPEMYESVMSFGKYPQSIFNKVVVGLTTFIIPVAMIGFFPAAALLGKVQWYMYLAIIPCFLFLCLGVAVYHYNVRLYEGVGG